MFSCFPCGQNFGAIRLELRLCLAASECLELYEHHERWDSPRTPTHFRMLNCRPFATVALTSFVAIGETLRSRALDLDPTKISRQRKSQLYNTISSLRWRHIAGNMTVRKIHIDRKQIRCRHAREYSICMHESRAYEISNELRALAYSIISMPYIATVTWVTY